MIKNYETNFVFWVINLDPTWSSVSLSNFLKVFLSDSKLNILKTIYKQDIDKKKDGVWAHIVNNTNRLDEEISKFDFIEKTHQIWACYNENV